MSYKDLNKIIDLLNNLRATTNALTEYIFEIKEAMEENEKHHNHP